MSEHTRIPAGPPMWCIHLTGFGLVAAIFGGVFALAVQQPLEEQAAAAGVVGELDDTTRRLQEAHATLGSLADDLDTLRSVDNATSAELLPLPRLAERIGEIGSLAGEQGLVVDEIVPGETRAHELCELVAVHMVGRGPVVGINRFLHAIASDLPDVDVRALRLDARERAGASVGFSVELDWRALRDARAVSAAPGED